MTMTEEKKPEYLKLVTSPNPEGTNPVFFSLLILLKI
jgi:hypothetical protein